MFENLKRHLKMNYEDDITSKIKSTTKPTKESSQMILLALKAIFNFSIYILIKIRYVFAGLALIAMLFIGFEYYTKEKVNDSNTITSVLEVNKELNDQVIITEKIMKVNSNTSNNVIKVINSNNINKNKINNIIKEYKDNNIINTNKKLEKVNIDNKTTDNTLVKQDLDKSKESLTASVVVDEKASKVIVLSQLSDVLDKEIIELPDLA